MLTLTEKALLIKLFHTNNESASKALAKFWTVKKMKEGRGQATENGFKRFVKLFEETRNIKNRCRSGQPKSSPEPAE